MKNTFGNNLTITLFGESHQDYIGATLDGLPAGIFIDEKYIEHMMEFRKPKGNISTARKESDKVEIISGLFENYTTGTPLTILIKNENVISKDYDDLSHIARLSHCDYSAYMKYLGFNDYRGSGHFSGRLTAAIVACGAICMQVLSLKDISIFSHIKKIGNINDEAFDSCNIDHLARQIDIIKDAYFAVIDQRQKEKMLAKIEETRLAQDSIGGIVESIVYNMPVGVGEPTFDSLESVISHAIFSIGGIKAVEFGDGIEMSSMIGSIANDPFRIINDKIVTTTNHNGGINAGISNGMPIIVNSYIKPTPSIMKSQSTVDFKQMKNCEYQINGRHDPCIVHRARIVIDSMIAISICDMLITRYGQLYFNGGFKKCAE